MLHFDVAYQNLGEFWKLRKSHKKTNVFATTVSSSCLFNGYLSAVKLNSLS